MRYYVLVSIVLASVLMTGAGPGLPTAKTAIQEEDREVNKSTLPKEPVKIAGMKNKKRQLKFNEKFKDGDDWLKGFTVTVHNKSGKAVTSLQIHLTFPRPRNHATSDEPPLGYDLRFNPGPFFPEHESRDKSKIIKPGEKFELALPDEDYEHIKRFLRELNYPVSITQVELMIHTVSFDDGTVWSGGTDFHPDPDKPGKLIRDT